MKTIALVIPWFGTLRDDFYFWMKSVEYNPTIDFLFITDQSIDNPPPNLKVIQSSVKQIEQLARQRIWEGCVIPKPYKLCDYKPTYGELFCDFLKDYDFWGHCDVDLVFGDIRHYVTDDILSQYDRIFSGGHLTIYRNEPSVNAIYENVKSPHYKSVLSNEKNFAFDEWGGTSRYWNEHLSNRFFKASLIDDVLPLTYSFLSRRVVVDHLDLQKVMFSFEQGKLYRYGLCNGRVKRVESLYVHFQKRHLFVCTPVSDSFSIIPNKYIKRVDNITPSYLKRHVLESRMVIYYIRFRNKIRKILGLPPYSNLVLFPEQTIKYYI